MLVGWLGIGLLLVCVFGIVCCYFVCSGLFGVGWLLCGFGLICGFVVVWLL